MTNYFFGLLRRTPTIDSVAPDIKISGVPFVTPAALILDRQEAREPPAASGDLIETLNDTFCVIDYCSADDEITRRRITMRSLVEGPNVPVVRAVCHERGAMRSFRTDRIEGIITKDGEVIDTPAFFRNMFGIDLSTRTGLAAQTAVLNSARILRERLRSPLSILVAAARADADFSEIELDTIMIYIESECVHMFEDGRLETLPTPDELDQLAPLVAAMRPQASSLIGHIKKLLEWDTDRFERLARALRKLIIADGQLHSDEIEFLEGINALSQEAERKHLARFFEDIQPEFLRSFGVFDGP